MRFKDLFPKFNGKLPEIDIEKLKATNPSEWKKLKKQFETGRLIGQVQLHNGLDELNGNTLRYFLGEYLGRFLNHGPASFPTSFNTLEPFFIFNHHNAIIQLHDDEEYYGVSLVDFLEFVTTSEFDLDKIDFYENIPENLIYQFSFTTGYDEINFSNTNGKTFYIGGLSIVRQGYQVSVLMEAGESYNPKEAEKYLNDKVEREKENAFNPFKQSLGMKFDAGGEQHQVVHFQGRQDLWLHCVALLFDIESKAIDLRYVGRDENISFKVLTDDYAAIFGRGSSYTKEEAGKSFNEILKKLSAYDAVFDFAKYCLALPYYVFENEDKIVDVTYETKLNTIIKGPLSKKKFESVPSKLKTVARAMYYLESESQAVIKKKELNDESFKVETSGYWRRLDLKEQGYDKNGRPILGKTWVERTDTFYTGTKGVTKVDQSALFTGENAGYIYVMRQPTTADDIFKIGLTTRNVQTRSEELFNTSVADKFFVIASFPTKNCKEAERQIHAALDTYRVSTRREFFRCNLKKILETCEQIIREINK